MISHQSFAIRFIAIKKRLQNGEVPLIYRITINGERAEGPTNRLVSLSLWDAKAQKATGKSDEAKEVNMQLDAIKTSLHTHQSRLVTLGKIVTAQLLKNEYLGITTDRKSLCESFDFLIKRKEELFKKGKLSETTGFAIAGKAIHYAFFIFLPDRPFHIIQLSVTDNPF